LSQGEEMASHKVGLSFSAFQKETLLCYSFSQRSFLFVLQNTQPKIKKGIQEGCFLPKTE
jgi:hypothetical protein